MLPLPSQQQMALHSAAAQLGGSSVLPLPSFTPPPQPQPQHRPQLHTERQPLSQPLSLPAFSLPAFKPPSPAPLGVLPVFTPVRSPASVLTSTTVTAASLATASASPLPPSFARPIAQKPPAASLVAPPRAVSPRPPSASASLTAAPTDGPLSSASSHTAVAVSTSARTSLASVRPRSALDVLVPAVAALSSREQPPVQPSLVGKVIAHVYDAHDASAAPADGEGAVTAARPEPVLHTRIQPLYTLSQLTLHGD